VEVVMPQEVDRNRVEALAVKLLIAIRDELAVPPMSRENVLVALNALAFAVATIITGTGTHREAHGFFDQAVRENIENIERSLDSDS
jgi:hypothetical protein